ncbi:NUDIX hydrolase [Corynebacterium maris]|uniref:NUDIX hydrolase n=1 Tax=Corynebacterium maris TaxID=575200 RepID=UPI0003F6C2E0|nr:NUDIX hydrolase [Corynebacterium maris]
MNDNDRTGSAKPGSGPANSSRPTGGDAQASDQGGGNSQNTQRRRGRRRSRRRAHSGKNAHGGPQQSQQQGAAGEAHKESGKDEKAGQSGGGAKRSRGRNRSRRRRGGQGGSSPTKETQSRQNAGEKSEKTGSKSRSGRPSKTSRGGRNARNQRGRGAPSRGGRRHDSRMTTRDETSAGGLVISGLAEAVGDDGEVDLSLIYVALIGRLDRRGRLLWSMPKGHVEPGEEQFSTAEREVWEETGIYGTVLAELGVIDYWFVSEGVRIHKTVYHHLLRYVDGELNDEDPEVTEVAWIPASELIEHLAYADERKLARIAHDRLPELARKERAEGRATPR